MPAPLIEAAVETVACAVAAVRAGAGRLELCADLARGGVTPSSGMIRAARAAVDVPLMVLIRPRPGDFVYATVERQVMREDIREARRAGANGVVVGALTVGGLVDQATMGELIDAADGLEVVMHRAVDQARDILAACEALLALGVQRVLTSGGAPSALQGGEAIAALVERFGGRVDIMAGGQIRADNVRQILRLTGVDAVHLGPRRRVGPAGMGERDELDIEQLAAVVRLSRAALETTGEP